MENCKKQALKICAKELLSNYLAYALLIAVIIISAYAIWFEYFISFKNDIFNKKWLVFSTIVIIAGLILTFFMTKAYKAFFDKSTIGLDYILICFSIVFLGTFIVDLCNAKVSEMTYGFIILFFVNIILFGR